MLAPLQPTDPLVTNWFERHVHPLSIALHLIGIPPTLLGVLLIPVWMTLLSWPVFLFALALFVGGYLLQFLGHLIEGTDPGEVIAIKRWLNMPYTEFPKGREPEKTGTA